MTRRSGKPRENDARTPGAERQPSAAIAAQAERDLNAVERERLALTLRLQGWDFDSIAEQCGYSDRSAARKAWQRALSRIPVQGSEEARKRMVEGYNAVRCELWKSIMTGDARAAEAWVSIDERESKLMGYDSPPPKHEEVPSATVFVRAYPPEWPKALPAGATASSPSGNEAPTSPPAASPTQETASA